MSIAVIKTGGKQYLVKAGVQLRVEKIPGETGDEVVFDDVLLVADNNQSIIGQPVVNGARVTATIAKQARGKKIIVQKYKPKVRYRRKRGHRQPFTEVVIGNISAQG